MSDKDRRPNPDKKKPTPTKDWVKRFKDHDLHREPPPKPKKQR